MSAPGPARAAEKASTRDDWETPRPIFDWLNELFRFHCDAAASASNAKCERFIDAETNALAVDWSPYGHSFFCNPPYGNLMPWVEKFREVAKPGRSVVALLPANTDTRWFALAFQTADIWFLTPRLSFELAGVPQKGNTGGSLVAIWGWGRGRHCLKDWRKEIAK